MVTNGNRYFGDKSANLPKVNFYFHPNNCHHIVIVRVIFILTEKLVLVNHGLKVGSRKDIVTEKRFTAAVASTNFLIMNLG